MKEREKAELQAREENTEAREYSGSQVRRIAKAYANIKEKDATSYLKKCAEGVYPSSYYHKNKCKEILDAFGDKWYSGNKEEILLFDVAISMVENNCTK